MLKASAYGPGYHLKWPWPISAGRKVPVDRIFGKEIGKIYEKRKDQMDMPPPEDPGIQPMTDPNVILWKELHVQPQEGYEPNFLVPSTKEVKVGPKAPAINLARVMAHAHYRVKRGADGNADVQAAYQFHYRHRDVHRLVDAIAYRVMCRLAASQNFLDWINKERGAVSDKFAKLLQEALDRNETGVEIIYAGIAEVHPPAETAKAFEDVLNAFEVKEKMVLEGRKDAVVGVSDAKGRAAEIAADANIYAYRLKALAEAEAERFKIQHDAYRKSPQVYRFRKYFSILEDVFEGHRLYIGPITQDEVQILDLQEKLRADMLAIDLEEELK